jgi:ATP-dependent Clp protease ATP-binding subunit ClpB
MLRFGKLNLIPSVVVAGTAATLYSNRHPLHQYQQSVPYNQGKELCLLALKDDTNRIKQLDITQSHPGGWHALHVSACHHSLKMAEYLLDNGISVNIPTKSIPTQNQQQQIQVLRERLHFFPNLNPQAQTDGFTPLHYAVLFGDVDMIKLLFRHGADPYIKCQGGYTPLDLYDPSQQSPELKSVLEEGILAYTREKERQDRATRRQNPLNAHLHRRLIGQQAAIDTVSSAIKRKQNGWTDTDAPMVFLFLGSSGVGKTELAKCLAEYLHPDTDGSKTGFIRVDMSEYQTKHEVSKLIGAPPSYIGYEEGGQLTEALKKCPDAVVLLDEVEKAHVDVLTVMLQVFDEGRLTDGRGQTVECKNAVFVMTSNLAQDVIAERGDDLRADDRRKDIMSAEIEPILKAHFGRDEFLGRINEVVVFTPFSDTELLDLTKMELEKWKQRAETKHGINLSWSEDVVELLSRGYHRQYGARSIKYEVDRKVVGALAEAYELEKLSEGDSVHVSTVGDKIQLKIDHKIQKNEDTKGYLW